MSILKVEDLSFSYDNNKLVLKNIDMDFSEGKVYGVFGKSGAGKTTLLSLLAGLEIAKDGKILYKDNDLSKINRDKYRSNEIGVIFQSYNLLPHLTALENVTFSLMLKGYKKEEREHMAVEMLKEVGLETRMDHKPSEMSGGQQQRVAIARAFVDRPKIIFADEPTGNLDTKTSEEIMDLTLQMASEYKQTLIIVSHDPNTSNYCDDTVRLRDGEIIS